MEEYARPYNQILRSKKLTTVYIDAFAGAGHHLAKGSGEIIKGSPVRALTIQPPFDLLHFVDMDSARTDELKRLSINHPNVLVHSGDANVVLPRDVFPQVRYHQYRRGLCILDPYGLHLEWNVIKGAGDSGSIEIFLNFPVMDMNMNVLWHDVEKVSVAQRERMSRFWGDDSWQQAAYKTEQNLFVSYLEKGSNDDVATAFRKRLKEVAGFNVVPEPMPMRNSTGAIVITFSSLHINQLPQTSLPRFLASIGTQGRSMAEHSTIEWTDATWNPVRGCSKISPGCKHCYAQTFAERFRGVPGHPYEQGFDLRLVPEKMKDPLKWKASKKIFVNSMSDLFHPNVPDDFIVDVANVMMKGDWHQFQVLTKRSDRLHSLLNTKLRFATVSSHIWWGVSVEDRRHGLPRIDDLRNTPAAIKFLSIEPLLESLGDISLFGINWVIVGGDSGWGARKLEEEWVQELLAGCRLQHVRFFFKQWGGTQKKLNGRLLNGRTYDELPILQ